MILASGRDFLDNFIFSLAAAKEKVLISTFRFEHPDRSRSKEIDRLWCELQKLTARIREVKVLLNLYDTNVRLGQINTLSAKQLTRWGVPVKHCPFPQCGHAKLLIVDDHTLILGSHNLSKHSLQDNFEVSALLRTAEDIASATLSFSQAWSVAQRF